MNKEKVKQYLRLDYDDSLVDNFILISESYLKDAIDNYDEKVKNESFKAKAEMVQLVLIQELYDNRSQAKKDTTDFSYVIRSMISQLQYWSEWNER